MRAAGTWGNTDDDYREHNLCASKASHRPSDVGRRRRVMRNAQFQALPRETAMSFSSQPFDLVNVKLRLSGSRQVALTVSLMARSPGSVE